MGKEKLIEFVGQLRALHTHGYFIALKVYNAFKLAGLGE